MGAEGSILLYSDMDSVIYKCCFPKDDYMLHLPAPTALDGIPYIYLFTVVVRCYSAIMKWATFMRRGAAQRVA